MKEIILDKIKKYETIIIHRHTRPDGDCMGSQIGLKEIITSSFPDKKVYVVGEEKEQFYYLGRMDDISDDVYKDALVIVVDVSNKERFSDSRYALGKELIKIDHHPKREKICEIEWVDTTYPSCCEMIVDFYNQFNDELSLSKFGAKALYYGMVTDTNRFQTPVVNKRTFLLASILMDYDLNLEEIYQNIYLEPENMIRLRSFVSANFIKTLNGLGYIKIDQSLCNQYNVDSSISNILVNQLSYIEGVQIWFIAIYDNTTNKIRISLRSNNLPINQFAEKYGGGGHKYASGIIIESFNIVDNLIRDLDSYLYMEYSK